MTYDQAGFNGFLDRSIGATIGAVTLNQLESQNMNSLSLDQLQVSGKLGNVFQVAGSVQGGAIQDLEMNGDLKLRGKLIIGDAAFVFDGRTVKMTVSDGTNDVILIGKDV